MTHYAVGANFERKVQAALEVDGYVTFRSAGSLGSVDVVAMKPTQTLLVQAKRRSGTIPPGDRAELLRLAMYLNALPIVAHQPVPRRPIRFRLLLGPGPKDWAEFTPDEVANA